MWRLAWPTVIQNMIGGLQGIVDHVMVGHYVGFTGNAAIGVGWQIFLLVIVFISSLFTGMGVLVARAAGANDHDRVNRVHHRPLPAPEPAAPVASTGGGKSLKDQISSVSAQIVYCRKVDSKP